MENFITDITNAYLPEFILTIFIVLSFLASIFFSTYLYKLSKWFTLLGITLALASTFYLPISPEDYAFHNEFLSNIYTVFFRILILMCGFFLVLLSRNLIREKRDKAFEYFTVLLSALLFAMCTVSVNDFVSLFVSLEGLGITTYLLLNFSKTPDAKQLSFGYLIQGAAASMLFLFGLSYLYGLCAQLGFWEVSEFFTKNPPQVLLTFSLVLITCPILFKLGLMPFSSWVADTFKGASFPIAAFVSSVPVLACFGILSRLLMIMLPFTTSLRLVFAIIAVLTVICGSLCAIRQTNVKKLMAYSMSVQSGIMLLGLCVFSVYSLSSVLFYLFCYVFSNIGVWSALVLFYNSCKKEEIDDFKGLIFHRPYFVISFTTVLIALAGLAPTCGFVAKLYIFSAVARSGFVFLPFLMTMLLASVIMIFAYWKLIRAMFRRVECSADIDNHVISSKFILYFCAIATVIICIYADKIIQLCQYTSLDM